ncbi:MAG: MFS transporter [Rhodobacterales bacterium]|nr:MFS transporter [Rhodobacterales bacterium]NCT13291.1 MFS transporter [Rhodobacterales bacterium]
MTFLRFVTDNWTWLLAGFILTFGSSYGQTFFISLFADQIMAHFGLTNGQWGAVYTVATTASAIAMIWMGGFTDRFRARQFGMFTLIMLALSCLSLSAMPAGWVAGLGFSIFALRFFGQGLMGHIAIVATARWFVATRGRALSIVTMGFAMGQAVLPLIFVALLALFDWRWLWVIAAAVTVLTIPAILVLLRKERTPQSLAESSQSLGMASRHWTRAETLRHWLFWLMVPLLIAPPAWGTALFFQQVHLVGVKGWTLTAFVALMPLYTAATIGATFASGWAIDRFGSGALVPFYMLPWAAGFVVLFLAQTILGAGVALVLLGLGSGISATVPSAFWAEYYGTRHTGSIKAAAAAIMVFGSAIGPGVSGALIDYGIDFPGQMPGIAAMFLLSGLLGAIGVARARPLLAVAA